jgi:hypothetical protein
MILNTEKKEQLNLRELHLEETPVSWVSTNCAIIVMHGIGNQMPMETLDQFGRGLVAEYAKQFPGEMSIQHCVITKDSDNAEPWFDNVVRLKKKHSEHYIDLYEYYWANYTEDKATWTDISLWLNGVVKGAKNFYEDQKLLGKRFKDESIFFDSDGNFKPFKYRFFIGVVSKIFIVINLLITFVLKMVSYVPIIGEIAASLLQSFVKKSLNKFVNVLGDISVYNVVDPKSKMYSVRRQILDGAVKSIKFLVEKTNNDKRTYPSVLVAGHSLGTQISFDAINKLNILLNQGLIDGYDNEGLCAKNRKDVGISKISDQLKGYITFGSPLDKIVFFLREKTPPEQILRQQLLEAYHCFKQLKWNANKIETDYLKLEMCLKRYLDDIPWRNYYDDKDYVSGRLDYYGELVNINCHFSADGVFSFTHSDYWNEGLMYRDIIINFLNPRDINIHTNGTSLKYSTDNTKL